MMGKAAIEPTTTQPMRPTPTDVVVTPRPKKDVAVWKRILSPVASLRVTVTLFVLSFVLVFAGTLAQIDRGIFTVVNEYFRTALVWIPFQLFVQFGQVF